MTPDEFLKYKEKIKTSIYQFISIPGTWYKSQSPDEMEQAIRELNNEGFLLTPDGFCPIERNGNEFRRIDLYGYKASNHGKTTGNTVR